MSEDPNNRKYGPAAINAQREQEMMPLKNLREVIKTANQKEREITEKMKKQLDGMKFNATPAKAAEFLDTFDEFCTLKRISKAQITVKRAKNRQSAQISTEK
jgi:uncharacterized membrane protein